MAKDKTNKIIEFRNVTRVFDDGDFGLKDVNFSIDKGEFVFIIGSSGAGKTTLMKHIVKEDIPNEGSIIIDRQDLSEIKRKDLPGVRRKVGYIHQDFKLLNSKTSFENVALSLQVVGKTEKEINNIVPNLLHLVGIGNKSDQFPGSMSGGEKQRLAIARALAHEPKILLADEPTGNLDETSTWVVVDLIKKINKWGTTVLLGTHEMDIVKSINRRVIHLEKGEIVKDTGGKNKK